MTPRPNSTKLRRETFAYWKIEVGDRIMLPCHCKDCKRALFNPATEKWDADHRIPREHGGSDEPPNVRPLRQRCHAIKTATEDIPAIAKGRRQRDKHYGITRKQGFRKPPEGYVFDWRAKRYVKAEELDS